MNSSAAVNTHMGSKEWGMLILLSILWGGSFFTVGIAVQELPTFTIVNLRVAIAALTLFAILKLVRISMPMDLRHWIAFFGMGLLNNAIPFSLIVWGQAHIASGLASILNAATPIFTVVVAHFLTADEKMSPNKMLGVFIGFAGVAMMIGMDALGELGTAVWAQLAIIGATLSYAFSGVWGRRFKRMGTAPMVTATGQLTASSLILLPVTFYLDQPLSLNMPGMETILAIVFLAVAATSLAYLLFFKILAAAGATNVMLVTLLVPVSAIILGAAFLGEVLALKHFLGMAMIALGLAAIDGRPWRMITGASKRAKV
ncbi:DMT family transporter [Curvivirga sp.]|uniref:DMT family transporter n=1 Tax=Curvivirga sp. TaxID=2856848 RepID=UPI003B595546